MTLSPCTCGHPTVHSIARGRTFDGVEVVLYSDGAVAGRMPSNAKRDVETRNRKAEKIQKAVRVWAKHRPMVFVEEVE